LIGFDIFVVRRKETHSANHQNFRRLVLEISTESCEWKRLLPSQVYLHTPILAGVFY